MERASYILPIKSASSPTAELTAYLRWVSQRCELIVVDASPPDVFREAHDEWAGFGRHVAPDPEQRCANGKVRGVLTGLGLATSAFVVIADDDVRYDATALERLLTQLEQVDLVVPQNYFDPLPWHARWDTARTLLNRMTGGDFPGTLAVRAELLHAGYDGDVLFENLELMRTVESRGGRWRRVPDLYVRRLPPTTRHFLSQRVRQAYDEFGRPGRCLGWLTVLPIVAGVAWCRSARAAGALAMTIVITAEAGRRRSGGTGRFPIGASLMAPLWVLERAVCMWLAVVMRARGGVPYSGGRIVRAATPLAALKASAAGRPIASVLPLRSL